METPERMPEPKDYGGEAVPAQAKIPLSMPADDGTDVVILAISGVNVRPTVSPFSRMLGWCPLMVQCLCKFHCPAPMKGVCEIRQ